MGLDARPRLAAVTYLDLRGNAVRPVHVQVGDRWLVGQLEAFRRDRGGTWLGFVRWSEGIGVTRIAWLCEGQIQGNGCR